jgi:pyruvyltransferase
VAARHIDTFWFRRRQNFGDAIAPHMVAHFAGVEAVWTPPRWSEAVVIGSVAGRVSHGYRGVVVGVGKIDESMTLDLSRARVLGLRGELTWRGSGVSGDIALGDSGLLAAELVGGRPPTQYALGVVPHYHDRELAGRYPDAEIIDVGKHPVEVIRKIAACERIVSSSLHGLITADSFGIARRWEPSERLIGGRFKFADYASALGIKLEPDVWATAPATVVAGRVAELRDAFRELPHATQLATHDRHERLRRRVAGVARLVPERRPRD